MLWDSDEIGQHRRDFMAGVKQQQFLTAILSSMVGAIAAIFWLGILLAPAAQAQMFQVLHTFSGSGDGAYPAAGLTPDSRGNFYGTTVYGGTHGSGVVFRLAHAGSGWILTPLYSFAGHGDGYSPESRAIIGPDGALYGTTYMGGQYDAGTLYRLSPPPTVCRATLCSWTKTILHTFPDPGDTDGFYPEGDLIFDRAGNLYGTTVGGGSGAPYGCLGFGCGVFYQMVRSQNGWTEQIVHEFTGGQDGGVPHNGVVLDSSGNFIGTTCSGGSHFVGLVFQISAAGWMETPIYNFQGLQDGSCPSAFMQDAAGNIYGVTTTSRNGTIYELNPVGSNWNFALLYQISSSFPYEAQLTQDTSGNLYGTADGGAYNYGTVFKLTFSGGTWVYSSLHDFTGGSDGKFPYGQLVLDGSGNIYGTASEGGNSGCQQNGCGVVWEITP